jgi:L-asparaginase/beta-aspartyl-peptidase (threonine type)
VQLARRLLEDSPHVFLIGDGAERFALECGFTLVENDELITPERRQQYQALEGQADKLVALDEPPLGTVGAVARDQAGRLAAATSTGGIGGKLYGRVGDSPIVGAGVWADSHVAISCTGFGEYFVRAAAAAQVSLRMQLAGEGLAAAADVALADVAALGGWGGLIAVGADGQIAMPFRSQGMKRAALYPDGRIVSEVF